MWQHVKLSKQIRPRDTLACCWDVKQPTNKQSLVPCLCQSVTSVKVLCLSPCCVFVIALLVSAAVSVVIACLCYSVMFVTLGCHHAMSLSEVYVCQSTVPAVMPCPCSSFVCHVVSVSTSHVFVIELCLCHHAIPVSLCYVCHRTVLVSSCHTCVLVLCLSQNCVCVIMPYLCPCVMFVTELCGIVPYLCPCVMFVTELCLLHHAIPVSLCYVCLRTVSVSSCHTCVPVLCLSQNCARVMPYLCPCVMFVTELCLCHHAIPVSLCYVCHRTVPVSCHTCVLVLCLSQNCVCVIMPYLCPCVMFVTELCVIMPYL